MKAKFLRHGFCFLFVSLAFATTLSLASLPDESLNLKLAAPIRTWDEAVPLGNGLLGGLLWGETNLLRLSLDRGDLWDLRTPPEIREPGFTFQNMQRLVRERNQKEIGRLFDEPYNQPTPTKIPAGRLEIVLDFLAFIPLPIPQKDIPIRQPANNASRPDAPAPRSPSVALACGTADAAKSAERRPQLRCISRSTKRGSSHGGKVAL